MYGELFFAGDHLQCIPSNLIIPTYINAPFLLILSEKGRVHNLFTHALVVTNTKSVFEVQPEIEKNNLILAVLCERTVDTGHCLRHSNKYYRMIDSRGNQVHYRKGTKVMFIQAFDGSQYCCVNDKDIYALEEIPEHETKSKDLDIDYTPPKPKKPRIPPMNHPWRRQQFGKFVKQQEHHQNDQDTKIA